MRALRPPGFTLLEVLLVLALAGILLTIAAPPLSGYLQRVRMRSTLDRFTTDLYHARMLAARNGERIHLKLQLDAGGCATAYEVRYAASGELRRRVDLAAETPGICLTISGTPTLSINSRGMPVGAARTIRISSGPMGDSLRISIVGRVHRLYSVPHAWSLHMRKRFPVWQAFRRVRGW